MAHRRGSGGRRRAPRRRARRRRAPVRRVSEREKRARRLQSARGGFTGVARGPGGTFGGFSGRAKPPLPKPRDFTPAAGGGRQPTQRTITSKDQSIRERLADALETIRVIVGRKDIQSTVFAGLPLPFGKAKVAGTGLKKLADIGLKAKDSTRIAPLRKIRPKKLKDIKLEAEFLAKRLSEKGIHRTSSNALTVGGGKFISWNRRTHRGIGKILTGYQLSKFGVMFGAFWAGAYILGRWGEAEAGDGMFWAKNVIDQAVLNNDTARIDQVNEDLREFKEFVERDASTFERASGLKGISDKLFGLGKVIGFMQMHGEDQKDAIINGTTFDATIRKRKQEFLDKERELAEEKDRSIKENIALKEEAEKRTALLIHQLSVERDRAKARGIRANIAASKRAEREITLLIDKLARERQKELERIQKENVERWKGYLRFKARMAAESAPSKLSFGLL